MNNSQCALVDIFVMFGALKVIRGLNYDIIRQISGVFRYTWSHLCPSLTRGMYIMGQLTRLAAGAIVFGTRLAGAVIAPKNFNFLAP